LTTRILRTAWLATIGVSVIGAYDYRRI